MGSPAKPADVRSAATEVVSAMPADFINNAIGHCAGSTEFSLRARSPLPTRTVIRDQKKSATQKKVQEEKKSQFVRLLMGGPCVSPKLDISFLIK